MSKQQSITIPLTKIKPASHRIFVFPVPIEEAVTKSGLVLPTHITKKDRHKNDLNITYYRYFVVAVGDKVCEPLEIGDEVMPLVFDGTTTIELPRIIDYANNGLELSILHDTEIMGYIKNKIKHIKEDRDENKN